MISSYCGVSFGIRSMVALSESPCQGGNDNGTETSKNIIFNLIIISKKLGKSKTYFGISLGT